MPLHGGLCIYRYMDPLNNSSVEPKPKPSVLPARRKPTQQQLGIKPRRSVSRGCLPQQQPNICIYIYIYIYIHIYIYVYVLTTTVTRAFPPPPPHISHTCEGSDCEAFVTACCLYAEKHAHTNVNTIAIALLRLLVLMPMLLQLMQKRILAPRLLPKCMSACIPLQRKCTGRSRIFTECSSVL